MRPRWILQLAICLLIALRASAPLHAQAEPQSPAIGLAIDRGLSFLQRQQKPDGSFDAVGPPNTMTALALLSFLASGHTPDAGKYGLNVRTAADYLVNQKPENGYFGRDGGRMFGHCIVTVALAQLYGTETDLVQRGKTRAAMEKALEAILAAQIMDKTSVSSGGWRSDADASDTDLSTTTWCIVALRACQDAGLSIPRDRMDRAQSWLLRCYKQPPGAFAYRPQDQPTAGITGAGLMSLYMLDAADRPEAAGAARFLAANPVRESDKYYFYSLYYATLAGSQAGDPVWAGVWKNASEQLLASQRKVEGSWPARNGEPGRDDKPGRFYSTAMACLTLSVPLRLLPIYQR